MEDAQANRPIENFCFLANLIKTGIPLDCEDKSLAHLIKASEYFAVDQEISNSINGQNSASSIKRIGVLFSFNYGINLSGELKDRNCRAANLAELLVLGFKYPGFQRFFPIVASASHFSGFTSITLIPYLGLESGSRVLRLVSITDYKALEKMCVLGIKN